MDMRQTYPGTSNPMAIELDGRRVEYAEIPGDEPEAALVFLHEGLGSVGLWHDFPARVAAATGRRALVYSRLGNGGSHAPPAARAPSFMYEEAREVLPRLLQEWGVEEPLLVGHSDGGSIALIHAAEHPVSAVACIAPHVFVEEKCLVEIRRARLRYEQGGLRERMAEHHRDPDAAFFGWNDVWLDPEFASWNIEHLLPQIVAPTLLIQGSEDPYGTLAQIDSVAAKVRGPVERVVLACRHAPHVQATEETLSAVTRFVATHGSRTRAPVR
jgi:pimeloyl-ACP methyl ester carboxylesterase